MNAEVATPTAADVGSRNGLAPRPREEIAIPGGTFALDVPATVPAVWGEGADILMAEGEPLMLVARPGVGKTTLAQQLILRRSGVHDGRLLGYPVKVGAGRVLYVAADRPQQARRSLRRMVEEGDRQALDSALVTWPLPLPFDLGKSAEGDLAGFVHEFSEIDCVVLDSLGHLAAGLSDDEVGGRITGEISRLVSTGVEVVVLHHQRKGERGRSTLEPKSIEDVYGSTWLTTGMGSVVHLAGSPGDLIVDLRHLKQPVNDVGPLRVRHVHEHGRTEIFEAPDLLTIAESGVTVRDAASALFETSDPDRNQIEKTRRRLDKLADRGDLQRKADGTGTSIYRRPA